MAHTPNISPEENSALLLEPLFFLFIIPILYLHTVTLQCTPVKTGQIPTQKVNYTDVCNYEVIKNPNIPEFTHSIIGWLPRDPLKQTQFFKTLRTFFIWICLLSLWRIIISLNKVNESNFSSFESEFHFWKESNVIQNLFKWACDGGM